MKRPQNTSLDLVLALRAATDMPMSDLIRMGGTPQADAALTLIMFATMSTPHGEAADRQHAGVIVAQILDAAAAGGFQDARGFLDLVSRGTLTPPLRDLATKAVQGIGGATKFFSLLELATTPTMQLGAAQ
ncbi:hypothetical protein [Massilia antarctica]|uniref:hypothetical protein n=1 Tax=Massilia antarctica TaxID=2765360 RepID=UPI00226E4BAE|nr:hypothetical protein [Massilia sp. H27-R4]MCY0913221.1 hypothetical protein [Massilia sp. H27-R4]